jgi:hypothetical protein
MQKLIPILLTVLLAGASGFALGRSLSSMDARMAAAGAAKAAACEHTTSTPLAFAGAEPQDLLAVRSEGVDCNALLAIATIKDRDGRIIFAHARAMDPATPETVDASLAAVARVSERRAREALPEWPKGADPGGFSDSVVPTTERAAYEKAREADLPLLLVARRGGGFDAYAFFAESGESVAVAALAE